MKKAAIIYSNHTPLVDAVISRLDGLNADFLSDLPDNNTDYNLVVILNGTFITKNLNTNVLACHYSLLPAFSGAEPVKEAVLAGVKVTGITVYFQNSGKIIAQYPLFIRPEAHFDEVETELAYLEQAVFPVVIENLVKDELVDIKTLFSANNGGKCGGICEGKCGGCNECSR